MLARKWRPRDFEQLVGQAHVVRALVNALDADRLHHAFLFTGTRGVGKTTLARVLAKCLNCESGVSSKPCGECGSCVEIDAGRFVDLIEVDAASRSKVDETRELMDNVQFTPARGRYKAYLIDEVHMFSEKSFNALLKTLEEPPPHVKFLLATTDPQKLPITVLSRCLKFNLKRLPAGDIAACLERILTEESIGFEAPALTLVARAADGSMRDALSLLDQAIAHGAGTVAEEEVRAMLGAVDRSRIVELLDAVAARDAAGALDVAAAVASDAADYRDVLGELVNTLHRIAVRQAVPEAADPDPDSADALARLAGELSPEDVQLYYEIGLRGRRDLALAPDPRLGFEMTVLRMLAFTPESEPAPASPATVRPGNAPDGGGRSSPPSRARGAPAPAAARPGSVPDGGGRSAPPSRAKGEPAPDLPAVAGGEIMPAAGAAGSSEPSSRMGAAPAPADPLATAALRVADVPPDPASLTPQGWRGLVARLGLSGLEGELASNTSLVEAQERRLKLALDPAHAQLTAPRARERLQDALAARLGIRVELDIALGAPDHETPASKRESDETRRRQAAVRAIEGDAGVRALCETFGARVDPALVRPID